MDLSGYLQYNTCVSSHASSKNNPKQRHFSLPKVFQFLWMENLSPVFPNRLFDLKQEKLVVVATSYSLTSFTKPDLPENWIANKELTACRLIFPCHSRNNNFVLEPLRNKDRNRNRNRNRNGKRPETLWGVRHWTFETGHYNFPPLCTS